MSSRDNGKLANKNNGLCEVYRETRCSPRTASKRRRADYEHTKLKPCTRNAAKRALQDVPAQPRVEIKRIKVETPPTVEKQEENRDDNGLHSMKNFVYSNVRTRASDTLTNWNNGIGKLPTEVLSEVFSFLSPQERRTVKLVCNRWYDACNIVPFINKEKMVIDAASRVSKTVLISKALRTLKKSKLKYFNLEFRRIQFENFTFFGQKIVPRELKYPVSFWEKCGNKIMFLHFVDCVLSEDVIKKLMTHCNNLRHLSWKYLSPNEYLTVGMERSGNLLKSLILKNDFVNTLSSLDLDIWNLKRVTQTTESEFFLQLLHKFPNLRSLQLKLIPGTSGSVIISVNEELLMVLVKSRLEFLSIERGQMTFDADMSVLTRVPVNSTLRRLRLAMWKCGKNIQLCFVLKFKSLQNLEFTEISGDTILQNIWKNQTNLTSMKLNWLHCTNYGFTGRNKKTQNVSNVTSYSIRRLKKLEILTIVIVERKQILTEEIFSDFCFPNLHCIDITLWAHSPKFNTAFVKWVLNHLSLEDIRVRYNENISYASWIIICSTLKNLRNLYIDNPYNEKFTERQYKRFFHCAPSLRCIEHIHLRGKEKWRLDILQNKLLKEN